MATFAWAPVGASRFQLPSTANDDCAVACNNFHLAPILTVNAANTVTNRLCRFQYQNSAGTVTTLYGDEGTNDFGTGVDFVSCIANSAVDGKIVSAINPNFECACCGTINKEGKRYSTGCPTVTQFVASNTVCPGPTGTWTDAGSQICRVPGAGGAPDVFGSIVAATATTAAQCRTPLAVAPVATFDKLCYKINPYAGPPAPNCHPQNTGNTGK